MERIQFFGENTSNKDNFLKKTGRGILHVGAVVGSGILLGMGIETVRENN